MVSMGHTVAPHGPLRNGPTSQRTVRLRPGVQQREALEHRLARPRESAGAARLERAPPRGPCPFGAERADADRGVDLDVLRRALDRVAEDLARIGELRDQLEDAR